MPKQPRGREARGEEVAVSRWDSLQVSFVSTSANLALARELSEVRISRSRELSRPDRSSRPRCYPPQSLIVMIACHATSDNLQWCPNIETRWIPWNQLAVWEETLNCCQSMIFFPTYIPQSTRMTSLLSDSFSKFGFVLSRGSLLLMPVVSDDPKWFSMTTVDQMQVG